MAKGVNHKGVNHKVFRHGAMPTVGKKSAGARRSTTAGADVPPPLGIEITFSREGRLGMRMIRVSTRTENTVSTSMDPPRSGKGRAIIRRAGGSARVGI